MKMTPDILTIITASTELFENDLKMREIWGAAGWTIVSLAYYLYLVSQLILRFKHCKTNKCIIISITFRYLIVHIS